MFFIVQISLLFLGFGNEDIEVQRCEVSCSHPQRVWQSQAQQLPFLSWLCQPALLSPPLCIPFLVWTSFATSDFFFTMCEQWYLEDIYSISFKDIPDYRYEKKPFLNRTLLVQELRSPIDKWDLTKLKVFRRAEKMTNEGKRKPTEWERIFTSHETGRGSVSGYIKNSKKQMTHSGFGSAQSSKKKE